MKIPYEDKVAYKFIVDGRWAIQDDQPTEADRVGNINNVYTAPRKPPFPAVLASEFGFTPTTAERVVDAPALPATGLTSAATPGEESQIERAHSSIVQPPEDTTNALSSPEGASTTTEHLANGVHVAYASESAAPKDRHIDETLGATFPQLVTDFADTIAARDGASTTLEYVASGLGAAIQSFVGVDPINPDKVCQSNFNLLLQLVSDGGPMNMN